MADIQLKNVHKQFGSLSVIKGVDLDIKDGEFMVFVGPSGSGKSTLLRMIAGLEELSEGKLLFDGEVVNNLVPSKRGIAMVFQSYALYPHMKVYDNMAFGLKLAKNSSQDINQRVIDAAKMLKIEHLLERLPRQLSGGQRQRVAIGRAIVRHPRVFLFDEPLSNLDAELRVDTRLEIARLHQSLHQATMVYVTHDQVEAMTLADRICVLRDGRIEQVGTPAEIYERPNSVFVAGFIGSPKMNFINDEIARNYGCVTLGVRAEHITLDRDAGAWQGSIVHSESLGSDSYLYVDIGSDKPIVVRQESTSSSLDGDSVWLKPNENHLYRFDSAGQLQA